MKFNCVVFICSFLFTVFGYSESNTKSHAHYPVNWKTWPVVKTSQIPDTKTPIPKEAPPLLVDTLKSYNWMNDNKGYTLTIRVNPKALNKYKTHGPYDDGITAVGVFEEPGIVFVTEHLYGQAIYGTYDMKGVDISAKHETLNPRYCIKCHMGYQDICKNGTCATPKTP